MKCPNCNAPDQTGNYCAECGAALNATCPSCGAPVSADADFCTQCGTRIGPSRRSRAGWVIAAAAIFVVALVFLVPRQTQRAGPAGMAGPVSGGAPFAGGEAGDGGAGGAPGMGGLSSDMRVNADRLFNRIMTAAENGNQAEVEQFMPMAIQAYGMVDSLDADGIYHLALLHLTAGDYQQASSTAERLLADDPNHILALGVDAEAAKAAGDSARARKLYMRLLAAYPEEAAKPRQEYVDHQAMLELYRKEARDFLGQS